MSKSTKNSTKIPSNLTNKKGKSNKKAEKPKTVIVVLTSIAVFVLLIVALIIFNPQLVSTLTSGYVSLSLDDGQVIKFSDLYNTDSTQKVVSDKIKALNGKTVQLKGFMAEQSPVDNSFMYLVNAPFTVCPFCVITDNTKLEVVSIYMANKSPIDYTTDPVQITGKLEVTPSVDSFGYTTQFRVIADRVEPLKDSGMDKEVTAYFNQLNQDKVIALLNIAYVNNYQALNSNLIADNSRSTDEKYDFIKTNFSIDYILEGINVLGDKQKLITGMKPSSPKIASIHNELIKLFDNEIEVLKGIDSINAKIIGAKTTKEKEDVISKLKELSDKNKQGFESFTKWNNSIRE